MRGVALAVLVLAAAACGGGAGDGPPATAVDSVALALERYDASVFDTLTWSADTAALSRGEVVWSFSCQKCHGALGRGDGGFVTKGDTLRPPSFREVDWRYAADTAGLRQQIFTGEGHGMPEWGLAGLPYRDIDAVARYILTMLRPAQAKGGN